MSMNPIQPRRRLLTAALFACLLGTASPVIAGDSCVLTNGSTSEDDSGVEALACGLDSSATSVGATAFGTLSKALNTSSTAIGASSTALGESSLAMGFFSSANQDFAIAIGDHSISKGIGSIAIGQQAEVFDGDRSIAIGHQAIAGGGSGLNPEATAIGAFSSASGTRSTALGVASVASGNSSIALGDNAFAPGDSAVAMGLDSRATELNTIAIGRDSEVNEALGVAIGFDANIADGATHSVALGDGSVADRDNSVSVGSAILQRQITNVTAGTANTDAVNLGQLRNAVSGFGPDAVFNANGTFTPQTYSIQGSDFGDVRSAFDAVDQKLTDLADDGGNGPAGPQGPQGPAGPQGPEGPAGGGPRVTVYDNDARDLLTLKGADGTRVANVADGVQPTDAVNVRQSQAGDAKTLSDAKAYTDARIDSLDFGMDGFRDEINNRIDRFDQRINRIGAMSGALTGMAMNSAGLPGRNRMAVGVGGQGSRQAWALGYQRIVGDRASVSLGAAFSGSESTFTGGAGVSW